MARKKVSTTVYLTEEQVAQLKELHRRTRVPIAEYIRLGIDLILQKHAENLPGQVSLFGDMPEDEMGSASSREQRRDELLKKVLTNAE
jgi:hypothetical protein